VKPSRCLFWLIASLSVSLAGTSSAGNRWVVFPADPETLPAIKYANLERQECLSALSARGIPFSPAPKRQTIDAPVLLTGPLHGVELELVPDVRSRPVLDCRLLLALDDLAVIAAARGIAIVRSNSIYRRGWARGPVQGHLGGVAIDVTELVKQDGTVLNVRKDFAGRGIGSATCGEQAKPPEPGKATELRAFVCALDQARIFNLLLSPHYDYRHRDHLHIEVRRGVRWFLTQ
jgi:hypothetical protein